MIEGESRAPSLGTFLGTRILVVGSAPEITPSLLNGIDIERLAASCLDWDEGRSAALVVDLREVPLAAVVAHRKRSGGPRGVLVLLSQTPLADDAVAVAGVDDVLVVPSCTPATIARRLRLLAELGRSRIALAFADEALTESVNGLAIADLETPGTPLVEVTPAFERLTQYRRDEMLGRNCRVLQRDDRDQPGVVELRAALRERRRATVVVRNYKKDGSLFWNEITVFPLATGGGHPRFMAGVQHDVTELVEARAEIETLYRALVDQRTFDQAILDGVEVGIITTDRDGRISFANRAARELLQLVNDVSGVDVAEVLGLADTPAELLGDEQRTTLAYAFTTREGIELDLELALSRGDGVEDTRVGFFLIFRDTREDKQRQEEHRRFERLAAMGTMVAGFAHEVRNPVAALRSITEELADELTVAGLRLPHPQQMLRVLERIERLVRTSLQFGRPAAPRRGAHRPWAICSTALSGMAHRTEAGGRDIRVDVAADLPDVYVDDVQIVQALVILLDNALDAAGAPHRVLLRVTEGRPVVDIEPRGRKTPPPPAAPGVRFEVVDDGPGIAAADLSRIFDPFFTTKPSGTGLGLSIAQQVVSENGGRLEVTSTRGGPTVFSIVVPPAPPRE